MPKAEQPKPQVATPEPPAPKPEPVRKRVYGNSLLGKVAVLASNASVYKRDDTELLDEIVTSVIDGGLSFREACWRAIRKDAGVDVSWKRLKHCSEELNTVVNLLMRDGWFSQFLNVACHMRRGGRALLPEDVLCMVKEDHVNFLYQIRDASDLLRDNPELLANDIRAAVQAHPDLVEPAE